MPVYGEVGVHIAVLITGASLDPLDPLALDNLHVVLSAPAPRAVALSVQRLARRVASPYLDRVSVLGGHLLLSVHVAASDEFHFRGRLLVNNSEVNVVGFE